MFVADGGELLMAQSYAKNMGLYGERVGALSIVRLYGPYSAFLNPAIANNSVKCQFRLSV